MVEETQVTDQERVESLVSDLVIYKVAPDLETAFSYTLYQAEVLLKAAERKVGIDRLSALVDTTTACATAFGAKSDGIKKHIKQIKKEHGLSENG